MRTRLAALALVLVHLASPAAAADPSGRPGDLTVTGALGGGAEIGRGSSTGLGELEIGVGWELGEIRPELGLVLGLSPGTYAAVRPGVHVSFPQAPLYARAALDWAHAGGEWRLRWLVAGAGAELRVTSVLGAFVEADLGIPLAARSGVGIIGRTGFAFRF